MGRKIIGLDTIEPDRDFIAIDEKPYSLRSEEELSLRQLARVRRSALVIVEKTRKLDTATDEEMAETEGLIDGVIGLIVIDLPAELLGKLNLTQKYKIVTAFMTAASQRKAGAKAGEKGGLPTTEDSLPASAASTEAPSTTG
jgi:hypothetical protein